MGPQNTLIVFLFVAYWFWSNPEVTMDCYLFRNGAPIWLGLFQWAYTIWGIVNLFYI